MSYALAEDNLSKPEDEFIDKLHANVAKVCIFNQRITEVMETNLVNVQ